MELRSGGSDPGQDAERDVDSADGADITELERIRAAYDARDRAAATTVYQFANPGYVFYLQSLEWAVLRGVGRSPARLEGASVLDIGCGGGYLLHRMVEFGAAQGTGVDLMPARIEAARERYPAERFVCASAAELPFADAEFDIITQFTCLSSVLDPALRTRIGAEMWRVLRPGGIVLSYDMRTPPWPILALRRLGEWRRRGDQPSDEPTTPTTPISSGELRRLFGAGTLEYESVGLAFGLCPVAERSQLLAQLLASIAALREHAVGVITKPAAA
jgi:SAM-dependent methyltransferase